MKFRIMNQNGHDNASSVNINQNDNSLPYVLIIEQPAPKPIKFRYKSEPSRGGLIVGAKSTRENKSLPKIQVIGYKGPVFVRVMCVTIDEPYRIHPHNLVGKNHCSEGICEMLIDNEEMIAELPNLGIQCVKKNDVERELTRLQGKNIDPFQARFEYCRNVSSINLNALRLCFHVFILTADMLTWIPLEPVVSDPIYDKKAKSELVITRLSHTSASVKGGQTMILLCENVNKDDVVIRFFDERLNWEDFGIFGPEDVHKQVAIYFKTPPYCDTMIEQKVQVNIQLRRKTDANVTSESRSFFFVPDESGVYELRKQLPSSQTVDIKNGQRLDIRGSTKRQSSSSQSWIYSKINDGIPCGVSLDHSSSNNIPDNDQSISKLLGLSSSQQQSAIGRDQECSVQLPPIRDIFRRNKHPKNVGDQNSICHNDSQAYCLDLPDETMMSMVNCDLPNVTERSHFINTSQSEKNPLPTSSCVIERQEETRPCRANVEVYQHAFHPDQFFSILHSIKNVDYTSVATVAETDFSHNGNAMVFEGIFDIKDLVSSNNMEALSESLSSSLSMST